MKAIDVIRQHNLESFTKTYMNPMGKVFEGINFYDAMQAECVDVHINVESKTATFIIKDEGYLHY